MPKRPRNLIAPSVSIALPEAPRPTGLPGRVLLVGIGAYRLLLSPLLPAACRYTPSCSAYALEAVEHHGAWGGMRMALGRVLRCHPWHGGGYDPVPRQEA
jgi:putative membrane protein insertion efficiency factor